LLKHAEKNQEIQLNILPNGLLSIIVSKKLQSKNKSKKNILTY